MKKTSKRVIAVFLTVVMTFSIIGMNIAAVATVFNLVAPDAVNGGTVLNADSIDEAIEMMKSSPEILGKSGTGGTKDDVIYPTIILPGISQSISYLADENGEPAVNADGDELSGGLLIIDQSILISTIMENLAGPLVTSLITQKDSNGKLADGVYNTISNLFAIQSSDVNGNPTHNLKTIEYKTSVAGMTQDDRDYFYRMIPMQSVAPDIGEDNIYLYAFPLIGDPMESARGLDEYIQFVKAEKNVDKVNIVTISLGGTIFTAYLELMKDSGYADINRVINVVSCLQGTDVMGDFFLRQFNLDDEFFFHEYIPMIIKESEGTATLGYLINIALKIFSRDVIYSILTAAVDGIIDTLMHNCPQFWAMIPTDRYDDVKAKYSEIWTDSQYAVLAEKLDSFQTAKLNLYDNLEALNSKGVLVQSVAGYDLDYASKDYCFFAVMKSSATTNSDAIIDIDSTSLGATYAPAGTVVSDDILMSSTSRLSPDGSIDISTCLFPDNTWFFHGQHHEVGRNDVVISLIGKLITGEIKDVNDLSDSYPQFNGNRNTRNITRWYFREAEEVYADIENGVITNYNQSDLDELKAAYAEAELLLQDTICEPSIAAAVSDRFQNALAPFGKESPTGVSETDKALEAICKFLDDTLYAVFGGGGFSDITELGFIKK